MQQIILTDENGADLGTMDILEAHTGKGTLHKAFSAFVFSPKDQKILIQKRSKEKMLFPGFWANTCCSHPREGENVIQAGERRLKEECGFTTELRAFQSFVYKAEDPNGRGTEYEYDTILIGIVNSNIELHPDPKEIEELKWVTMEELKQDIKNHPLLYAPWFHLALKMIMENHATP